MPIANAARDELYSHKILGCIFFTVSALAHGEARLALWSLSALLTSALSLYLLHRRRDIYLRPPVRDCLYAAMRLHRAFAIVGMRRVLKAPMMMGAAASSVGDRVYFAKAVLVNSSILPILLQALVLQLPLPLQAAVQVILPVLFVAWFDSTAAAWFGGSGGGGNSSEAQHVPLGSNEAGPGAALAPAPGTSAATPRLEAPRRLAARRGAPPSYPSPLLALMFGLGLAGVLFDVLLTVHNRPAAPPGS
ncbi:hypothetical protein CHLNCDRAFT_59076 [Chlorella variabilis]|uniref:Uncharacterized protein n=1 Tax=Chlorella variabilis TaxID=554065 RepID=E1ZQH7_CHLVA|nr:hypothetical protein CHLNCDRAFT_59076 [Chlorella variabilis]EFN52023.1 hypothetical protein CHLNCDRAFT_59076 [Chlorella variabilis]|eukprot:XP_005844125.1 hypothetical protein CHLNCDRAFT_59076 [Chlorella variabilis]